ncbi:unnamed protein product [Scytosiphon promiscuus]
MCQMRARGKGGLIGVAYLLRGSLGEISRTREFAKGIDAPPMSKERVLDLLADGAPGSCNLDSRVYSWRNVGWGSNMNQVLKCWVDGVLSGHHDCALDVTQSFIQQIRCPASASESEKEVVGWSCMFKPMPRFCTFDTERVQPRAPNLLLLPFLAGQDKQLHLTTILFVSEEVFVPPRTQDSQYSSQLACLELCNKRSRATHTRPPTLESLLVMERETARAALDFIYSHEQPWFRQDVATILLEESVSSVSRADRFVAIHVRRGDKLRNEAAKVEISAYLRAAALFLWESTGDRSGIESIFGVWLSSDDSTSLPEVQELASKYFPNVRNDKIVTISFRDDGPEHPNFPRDEIPTLSQEMTYELYVGLHAELRMMSEAVVFVGTFSSNVARLVYLMRESNGLPRKSTLSVDQPAWWLH